MSPHLTKCQRQVLAHLRAIENDPSAGSLGKIAATLELAPNTVRAALSRLNEAGLITTTPGAPWQPAVHKLTNRASQQNPMREQKLWR